MGRLAELWKGRSADAVAVELHRRWPGKLAGKPGNPRTLGNRLRELDKGENLEWWRRRPALLSALARVLDVEADELESLLLETSGATGTTALKLTAIGELRPPDLAQEELLPGLPEEGLAPERWTRHWWQVADPLLRELIARWHEHHPRAAVVRKPTWAEALPVLPRSGRVLLVLDGPPRPPPGVPREPAHLPEVDLDAEPEPGRDALAGLRGLFLCVLAPHVGSSEELASDDSGGWHMLRWPDPDAWLPELAEWARARARPGGGLRKKSARTLLPERLGKYAPWFVGPREALELCALLDEIGCGEHDERTLARRYLESLWREHEEAPGARRGWLREHGFKALLSLIGEVIFHHGDSWVEGLTRERWEALVPAEAHADDVEGARALLGRGPLTEAMRSQVLAKLDPGPRRLVDDLAATGVLRPRADGRLEVTPRWLAKCLREAALEDMSSAPWEAWARGLVQPVFASREVSRLAGALVAGDFARLDEVLARATDQEYAHLLAIDTCVRAAGLARLREAEPPRERLAALWRALCRVVRPAKPGELPRPPFEGKAAQRLLAEEMYAVACVLITEVLTEEQAGAFAVLWRPGADPRTMGSVLNPVEAWFRSLFKRRSKDLDALLRLGARWLERCGPPGDQRRVNELLLPAWVARELLADAPDPKVWRFLENYHIAAELPALMLRHCELAGLPFSQVIARAWRAWDPAAHGGEPHPWFWWARDARERAGLVWKHLPGDVMRGHLRAHLVQHSAQIYPNAWRFFDGAQWETWMRIVRDIDDPWTRHDLVSAWEYVPEDFLWSALESGDLEAFPGGVFEIAWTRLGPSLSGRLLELRHRRPRTAWSLVHHAPEPWREVCLDRLLDWLDGLDELEAKQAEEFLRRCVATRGPLAPRAWDGLRKLASR